MIKKYFEESIDVKKNLINDVSFCINLKKIADECVASYLQGGKILICGNGGSASDALHMTGELVGRFQKERDGIPAVSLNENVAIITAIANDYEYDKVFSKQVVAYGVKGDVLICISTSGNSESVFNAACQGKKQGLTVVGFTGESGGKLKGICDYLVKVPSKITSHIQESHICIIHVLCKIIEEKLFP